MLKNGAASVISSSDTVGEGGEGTFIRGGRLNKGAFIRGGRLNKGRLLTVFTFYGAFI